MLFIFLGQCMSDKRRYTTVTHVIFAFILAFFFFASALLWLGQVKEESLQIVRHVVRLQHREAHAEIYLSVIGVFHSASANCRILYKFSSITFLFICELVRFWTGVYFRCWQAVKIPIPCVILYFKGILRKFYFFIVIYRRTFGSVSSWFNYRI